MLQACRAFIFGFIVLASASPGHGQTSAPPREVNITSDSAPGWLPTEEEERNAIKAATSYLDAVDQGRVADAHLMLADIARSGLSRAELERSSNDLRLQSGPLISRRIVKVTWTKDPRDAPARGIYAAIDLATRYSAIDRHCGYIVVFQPPGGGAFKVMRQESAALDNKTAQDMAAKGSAADVDRAWRALSANCPNYPDRPPMPESKSASIGYPDVATALSALRSTPGVEMSTKDGWTIAINDKTGTVWSFSPPGYPAYPAVVKRQVVEDGTSASIVMSVHCEASKVACDNLVDTFQKMNEQMRR